MRSVGVVDELVHHHCCINPKNIGRQPACTIFSHLFNGTPMTLTRWERPGQKEHIQRPSLADTSKTHPFLILGCVSFVIHPVWGFPARKMGVPQARWMVFVREDPKQNWMMTGGYHHFRKPHPIFLQIKFSAQVPPSDGSGGPFPWRCTSWARPEKKDNLVFLWGQTPGFGS